MGSGRLSVIRGFKRSCMQERQDLDLFAVHAGRIPKPFFDTQIAAAMVGWGPQIAYANLVQRVHGRRLDKAHTFTNWSARPLSQDQLAYALEDVTFLLAIHDHLHIRLSDLGRLQWADEEFSRLESVVGETRREPQERYQRIRGWDQLKPKSAAVLRELTAWREGEAKNGGMCLADGSSETKCCFNSRDIRPNSRMSCAK